MTKEHNFSEIELETDLINLGLWLRQDNKYFSWQVKERFIKWLTIAVIGSLFQIVLILELLYEFN